MIADALLQKSIFKVGREQIMNEKAKAQQFENLYRSERSRLERIAMRKVNPFNAADVVQEVFATIWSKAKERVTLSPAYLSQATKFTAISHFRAEYRRKVLLDNILEEQISSPVSLPDQIISAREDLQILQQTITDLPERTRKVFILSRLHGCSYEEISVALGISYSTVERDIAKAMLACKLSGNKC